MRSYLESNPRRPSWEPTALTTESPGLTDCKYQITHRFSLSSLAKLFTIIFQIQNIMSVLYCSVLGHCRVVSITK